jgi:hypothetical protein
VFLGILGVVADSLNHLVFTMPFLPSEGEETKLLINQQMKDVLVFHCPFCGTVTLFQMI